MKCKLLNSQVLINKRLIKNFSFLLSNSNDITYELSKNLLFKYKNTKPVFGYNGLGEFVYKRTYSRLKNDEKLINEEWIDTVQRVVEGTFSMNGNHLYSLGFNISELNETLDKEAELMFDKIFNFKFLPPGRGLWAMGSKLTKEKKIFASLNNCAFVSTKPENISVESIIKPYLFLMDSSMLGIGVGFDTKASESNVKVYFPEKISKNIHFVEDSREGWVKSVELLMTSFFKKNEELPVFDYSLIRPAGSILKTFGGKCAGYIVLKDLHDSLVTLIRNYTKDETKDHFITSRLIVDIMNIIGKSVVAGNIRRSAEIALGESTDESFINLKNYKENPERISYGWVSNNSVFCNIGMSYKQISERVSDNGEPGILWLDNMKSYSRMVDKPDFKDNLAKGGNPCLEQTLESYEMCCLVETFPNNHDSLEEYNETLKSAFLYAKSVTLGMTLWKETNDIIKKNRRIGVSMTGIAQFLSSKGIDMLKVWCNDGYKTLKDYDSYISKAFKVNESIKITSIKPSGTVSLLAGATPGMHFPNSRFYLRRVRVKKDSDLVHELANSGYHVEPDVYQPESTMVVSFPIDIGEGVRTLKEVGIWEQLSLAAFLQKYWADNQVSCTVSFNKAKEGNKIESALEYFQYQLKGISFLPLLENESPYPQMPYEEITEEEYKRQIEKIKTLKVNYSKVKIEEEQLDTEADKFCDGDKCVM